MKLKSIIISILATICITTNVLADTAYINTPPNVTTQMLSSDYWINKLAEPNKVLMTKEQITAFNTNNFANKNTHMTNLATVNLSKYNLGGLRTNLALFTSPTEQCSVDNKVITESYFNTLRQYIKNSPIATGATPKYAVCTEVANMKSLPTTDIIVNDLTCPEDDYAQLTKVRVNEPLIYFFSTADNKFSYVLSEYCSGWVETSAVAIAATAQEWSAAQNPDSFLVVTGDKIYLEESLLKPQLSGDIITMGTKLALSKTYSDSINNRSAWTNYVVDYPVRNANGYLEYQQALIGANRDVSVGYVEMTQKNIIELAYKHLGNRYGWGGMFSSSDCSSYIQDIFSCFGLKIARNTSWQAAMNAKKISFTTEMSSAQRTTIYDSLEPGTILGMTGHTMLYLGKDNGKYYVINDLGSVINPTTNEFMSVNTVSITELNSKRRSGISWFDSMTHAMIIWQ